MVRILFQLRPVGQPQDQAKHRAEHRADDPHHQAVRPDDQADVAVGAAGRREHRERAAPSLSQNGEARDRDQGDEEHRDGKYGERDGLGIQGAALPRRGGSQHVRPDRAGLHPWRVEEHGDLGGGFHLPGPNEGELVEEVLRVLHDADDPARYAALAPGLPGLQVEVRRDTTGHRRLVGCGREMPGDQGEHRLAEGAVGVLGAQLVGIDRTWDGDGLVLDDVDLAEAVLQGGDLGGEARIGTREGGRIPGRAETRAGGQRRVGRDRCPDDRGSHRHDNQREHEQLLAPLMPEQPPRPAKDRTPGRGAAVLGCPASSWRPVRRRFRGSLGHGTALHATTAWLAITGTVPGPGALAVPRPANPRTPISIIRSIFETARRLTF